MKRKVSDTEKIVWLVQGLFESTEVLDLLANYVELPRQTHAFVRRQLRRNLKTLKSFGTTGIPKADKVLTKVLTDLFRIR